MSDKYMCALARKALRCAGIGEVPNMKHSRGCILVEACLQARESYFQHLLLLRLPPSTIFYVRHVRRDVPH